MHRSESGGTRRLFIALWPGPAEFAALQDRAAAVDWPSGAEVQGPERLHLTLHFLGAVPANRIDVLKQVLDVPLEPFDIEFGGLEVWHRGIAVLRPTAIPAPLTTLHAALGNILQAQALTVDGRPYRPHVTLARAAGSAQALRPGKPWRWTVAGYALAESVVGHHGGYRILSSYPASAAA